MPLDPYSYVAPSRVKVLVCPLGHIKQPVFLQYADRLSRACEVRLVDVSPDHRADRAMFTSLGYPNGKVVYDISMAPIENRYHSIYDLEPYRQTFAIFAITQYHDGCQESIEIGLKKLRSAYPLAIIHKVLVFGVPGQDLLQGSKHILPILSTKVSSFTSLETAMCDITSDFLAELAVYMISRQMGSFKSPGMKALDPQSEPVEPGNFNTSMRGHSSRQASPASASISTNSSVSKTGSISLGLSERSKSKQNGRMLKFLGNMYLLAGRIPDAMREFTEAASILKSSYDHLWYASALESIGVCLVLQAFLEVPIAIPSIALSATLRNSVSHTDSLPSLPLNSPASSATPPSTSPAPTAVDAKLPVSRSSVSLSSAAPNLSDFLPDLTEAVLRFYTRSGTNDEESVPQIVYCECLLRFIKLLVMCRYGGGWNGASLSAIVRGTPLSKNITIASPSSSSIAKWCNRILSTDLNNLPLEPQVRVYSGLASIYGSIDLHRKQGFILRQMLTELLSSNDTKAGALLASLDEPSNRNGSVVSFLNEVSLIYSAGSIMGVGCGWVELKMSFLKTCLSLCESIKHYEGVVHFASILLSTVPDILSKEEQLRLFGIVYRSIEESRKSHQGIVLAKYWDRYILRDIRLLPSLSALPVLQKLEGTSLPETAESGDNIFLYNPYTKQSPRDQVDENALVANERAEFLVKLQNPFFFEVHVVEIVLLSDDKPLDAVQANIYLKPSSVLEFVVPCVPRLPGDIKINGCRIQVLGCAPMNFPLLKNVGPHLNLKTKENGVSSGKPGLTTANVPPRELEFRVMQPQPMLHIKSLSLDQGWVMLLEGEKQSFFAMVKNSNEAGCNIVQFNFTDSTAEPLQAALADKDLSPTEVYECEYFLLKRQALRVLSTPTISGHSTSKFEFELAGKRGMTHAAINMDYGNRSEGEGQTAWIRRLTMPISVTVSPSVELAGSDIIPMPQFASEDHPLLRIEGVKGPLPQGTRFIALVVDLRNAWSQVLETSLRSYDHDGETVLCEVTKLIYPSRTSRFILPINWDLMSTVDCNKPVPSLMGRQFVKSTSSTDQKRFMRESFWYREEILRVIRGTWRIHNSERQGVVELRGIRLSRLMVNTLRTEPLVLSMDVTSAGEDSAVVGRNGENVWKVASGNENLVVRTKIVNNYDHPLSGVLRIVPSLRYFPGASDSDDINMRMVYNGLLQRPVFNILPGQIVNVDLGVMILSRGEYEWTSVFEVSRGPEVLRQFGQQEPMYIKAI